MEWYFDWEFEVLDFLYEHHVEWLDQLMLGISFLGDSGWIWIVTAITLMLIPKYRVTGVKTALSLLLMLLIGNIIMKPTIARIRPYDINTAIELIGHRMADYSFPSGHTYASFAAAGVLIKNHKEIGIPALILAFLIAFSRMYLYVHFPTDVLAGMLLGALTALFSDGVVNYFTKKRLKK